MKNREKTFSPSLVFKFKDAFGEPHELWVFDIGPWDFVRKFAVLDGKLTLLHVKDCSGHAEYCSGIGGNNLRFDFRQRFPFGRYYLFCDRGTFAQEADFHSISMTESRLLSMPLAPLNVLLPKEDIDFVRVLDKGARPQPSGSSVSPPHKVAASPATEATAPQHEQTLATDNHFSLTQLFAGGAMAVYAFVLQGDVAKGQGLSLMGVIPIPSWSWIAALVVGIGTASHAAIASFTELIVSTHRVRIRGIAGSVEIPMNDIATVTTEQNWHWASLILTTMSHKKTYRYGPSPRIGELVQLISTQRILAFRNSDYTGEAGS